MIFTPHHSSSAANLYTLLSGNSILLLEAGVKAKAARKTIGYGLSAVDGCLITHSHGDHAKGAVDFMGAGVDCFMTRETADAIGATGHHLRIIEPLVQFQVGIWTILPFPTEHDAPGSVGYLISDGKEKCLFITDSYFCRYRFNGVSIFAVECNYSDETISPDLHPTRKQRLLESHFSLKNVVDFLKASDLTKCREIHLLHLSDENSDAELFKTTVQAATGVPVYVAAK